MNGPGDGRYALIVVGSGISGLFVALEARARGPVLVVTKGSIDDCNTRWAQGGIAAAVGMHDSPAQHLADTIAAGAGLVDEEAARVLCAEAPARIADLQRYGVGFDATSGRPDLALEAAHSQPRVLHAGGDRTGAAIETALGDAARARAVRVLDHTFVTRIVLDDGRAAGIEALDLASGETHTYTAPAVVIATGGAGQLYAYTTNPAVATGDGIALAFEAGAELADIEFYQFHPTAFCRPGAQPFLISEAVRGAGAILLNLEGEPFMRRYDPRGELAPRDVVARAMVAEMAARHEDHVLLDCTGLDGIDVAARFPGIFAFCSTQGIDVRSQPVPVAPAAHYFMGGVRTDSWGRTTVPGLYACGEAACTGVHGANRLASNSLMETVVFGKRVVEHLAGGEGGAAASWPGAIAASAAAGPAPSHRALQALMWRFAGIERSAAGLAAALAESEAWGPEPAEPTREWHERRQMATLARLLLAAALARTESRGAHFRSDYPLPDERWRRRQVFRRAP